MDEKKTDAKTENQLTEGNVVKQIIEDEMKNSYLEYAMSVIISRALPDVRDGLKPVHRRVLYAMHEMGMLPNKPYKKSARIVGEVLGKFHPHGDSAVYNTMVRMTQNFSLRYPLIDGQGNFGSIDGDSAAAMRYTEARLAKISLNLLEDLEKDTVEFTPNFDGSLKEPSVLPAKLPNLLLNGSSGIAVGMATNIPPHNIVELIDGIVHLIDNPDAQIEELMEFIKGPDFPTGGIICGTSGIKSAYMFGRGRIIVRCKSHIEDKKNRKLLIIDEIPYMVNKSQLIEHIADQIRDKRINGIADIRDESDRQGMRIVFTLKKDADSDVVLNQLYKHSRLQVTFGVNSLALVDGAPKTLNLKEILDQYILHRKTIVTRRTKYELKKAEERAHILEGLMIALSKIDKVISLIKSSESVNEARISLMSGFGLSEKQSSAILEMRLQKLTSLEQNKIKDEHKSLLEQVEKYKEILGSESRIFDIIKKEVIEIKEKFKDERRTEIIDSEDYDIDIESIIKEEDMAVTVTHSGYIKRLSLDTYKKQKRGGKGIIATATKEEDFVEHMFTASTHSYILFFTDNGQVYWLKVYKIPEGSRTAKGKAIVNLLNISKDEKITAMIPVREFNHDHYLIMATKNGTIKRVSLKLFSKPRRGGIRAITLGDDDHLVNVRCTDGNKEIMLATRKGQAVRFKEKQIRSIGRSGKGVKGISLKKNDNVVGSIIVEPEKTVLTITKNGYGKRTKVSEYRLINRGGVGVINIRCSERNGPVISIKSVLDDDEVMLISKNGIVIRMAVKNISCIGRSTQGVRLMKLNKGDEVGAVAKVIKEVENEMDSNMQ